MLAGLTKLIHHTQNVAGYSLYVIMYYTTVVAEVNGRKQ